ASRTQRIECSFGGGTRSGLPAPASFSKSAPSLRPSSGPAVYPLDVTTLGRHFWFSVLALGYVCMEAARAGGGASPWVAMALLPLLLAEAFRRDRKSTPE